MNKLPHSIILILLAAKLAIADPTLDYNIPDPIGPIKSLRTVNESKNLTEEIIYDDQGNLVKSSRFDEDGRLLEENVYTYDANNIKIKDSRKLDIFAGPVVISYGKKGEVLDIEDLREGSQVPGGQLKKWTHKYNQKGDLIEKIGVDDNGNVVESTIISYNDGKVSTERYTKKGFPSADKVRFEYDAQGNKSKELRYGREGKLYEVSTFSYDGNGNKTEWVKHAYFEGAPRDKIIYKYDTKGHIIQSEIVGMSGAVLGKRVGIWDEKGNLAREDVYDRRHGILSYSYRYKYDDKGNLTEWAENHGEETSLKGALEYKFIFKYEYDRFGNWIKKDRLIWQFDKKKYKKEGSWSRTIIYR